MLVVLNIRYSLCKVAVWADARSIKAVLDLAEELFNNWNSVFTDHNTLHFIRFDLAVPFMGSNIRHSKSLDWISV
jgi:hypothetical protein